MALEPCLPEQVAERINDSVSCQLSRSADPHISGLTLLGHLTLGDLRLISSKTSPLNVKQAENERLCLAACFAGSLAYGQGRSQCLAGPGELLVYPNQGGVISTDFCSAIMFEFDPKRLQRTMASMTGIPDGDSSQGQALLIRPGKSSASEHSGGALFHLFAFLDSMLQEDASIPDVLGMDEQIFRTLCFEWLRACDQLAILRRRRRDPVRAAVFDQLVDYILANLDRPISLTDLEEQSHYSGRQLQYLFQRKFNCTPIQFVRRQRLKRAMTRLEQAHSNDSVTAIAREFGYRNTGSFSADFHRQFAVHPSVILREARHRNGHGEAVRLDPAPTAFGVSPNGDGNGIGHGLLPMDGRLAASTINSHPIAGSGPGRPLTSGQGPSSPAAAPRFAPSMAS